MVVMMESVQLSNNMLVDEADTDGEGSGGV